MVNYKRAYAAKDDSGHWYVIPYELKTKFYELVSLSSAEYDEDLERNDLIQSYEDEFENIFSVYMTGGDINLIELYIKDEK